MPFERMRRNRVPEGKPWVTMRCSKRSDMADQIAVVISATLAAFLELKEGSLVTCERGTGDDLGWMLVYKHDSKDSFMCSTANVAPGNVRFNFNAGYLLTEGKHPKTKCPSIVPIKHDGRRALKIELPFWAYPQWDPGEMFEEVTS
jgi:hypothetical protein